MVQKRTNKYWQRRFERLKVDELILTEEYLAMIDDLYRKSQREIEKEISDWYRRFMDNEGIESLAEAKIKLNKRELAEFRWTVNEYIKYGQANELNHTWIKELENASARWHIERLEALEIALRQQAEALHAKGSVITQQAILEGYKNSYYTTAFGVSKGAGVGIYLPAIDRRQLDVVLKKPWAPDGKDFSARIWENRDQLVGDLHKEVVRMAIQGDGPDEAIKRISDKYRVSKHKAGRLIQTESAAFSSRGRRDCFNELGVEKFVFIATLDMKTSEICQQMDGVVTLTDAFEKGVTAPPMHPHCRSTTAPFFEDMVGIGSRAARDPETGKTVQVPRDMTYQEWHEKYVDSNPEAVSAE